MADSKELHTNLSQYRAQLEQVEAALTIDKDNEELKKLKQDLEEVINLTADLLKVNEKGTSPAQQKSIQWKVGDKCQAVFSQDGNYYDATIDVISDDLTTCTVSFEAYGNTEIVKVTSLRAAGGAVGGATAGAKRTFTEVGEPSASNTEKTRAEKDKVKDIKRKKMAKKQQRVKEIEEQREREKNNWLDFFNNSKGSSSGKSKSGKLKGMSKKSIFASPDSANGKVGVGTCGIGGQPMTQFTQPDKLVYKR